MLRSGTECGARRFRGWIHEHPSCRLGSVFELKMSLPPRECVTHVIVNLLGESQNKNLKKVFLKEFAFHTGK